VRATRAAYSKKAGGCARTAPSSGRTVHRAPARGGSVAGAVLHRDAGPDAAAARRIPGRHRAEMHEFIAMLAHELRNPLARFAMP
jgi:signal transduction histidine kinase